jgi:aspartate ammonia-lyase
VDSVAANEKQCRAYVEQSAGLVTAPLPVIGYEAATAVDREALESGSGIYDLILQKGLVTGDGLEEILEP